MADFSRISTAAGSGASRMFATYHSVRRQPSWITQAALLVFLLVIGVPIVLFVLFAFTLALIVFGSLALLNALVMRVRGILPGRPAGGRSNVRVIVRDEQR